MNSVDITDGTLSALVSRQRQFDVGVWAAGYESRSRWLVESYCERVEQWYRVEFTGGRDSIGSARALALGVGELLGCSPAPGAHDGYWLDVWESMLNDQSQRFGRSLNILVDYSSMPRTVYGAFVIGCKRNPDLVASLAMAYVPGVHGRNRNGSRSLNGLRALVGTEGSITPRSNAAYVLGLGYDGVLAEAVVDLFQISCLSVVYADPGVTPDAVERTCNANVEVIARSDFVRGVPAWSVGGARDVFLSLCAEYWDSNDTVVVPLGPKPHVLGALLACLEEPRVGFRFLRTGTVEVVEVTVADGIGPFVSLLRFKDAERGSC